MKIFTLIKECHYHEYVIGLFHGDDIDRAIELIKHDISDNQRVLFTDDHANLAKMRVDLAKLVGNMKCNDISDSFDLRKYLKTDRAKLVYPSAIEYRVNCYWLRS